MRLLLSLHQQNNPKETTQADISLQVRILLLPAYSSGWIYKKKQYYVLVDMKES